MQPTICLNCETALSDGQRFCPNCGQKTDTHRLTWKHFSHEVFHALAPADKGLVYLFKKLVLRPGVVAREYLAGKRPVRDRGYPALRVRLVAVLPARRIQLRRVPDWRHAYRFSDQCRRAAGARVGPARRERGGRPERHAGRARSSQLWYLTYGLTGFLQLKSLKARLGGATVALLSQLTWMAVAYSLYGAFLFRNRQFYQFPLRVFRALVTF